MEFVVLVDTKNRRIGTAPKDTVHTTATPLHRGFSVFLFNDQKQILITKRASGKKTFPGLWTNAVCGHTAPGETVAKGAKRRLSDELGFTNIKLRVLSDYRYRFTDANGIVENEICPILVGYTKDTPLLNKHEADSWKWMNWITFLADIENNPSVYSPWCREEASIIRKLQEKGQGLP